MLISAVNTLVLDALEKFDQEILPLGLYGSDDLASGKKSGPRFMEWQRALQPFFRAHGGSLSTGHRLYNLQRGSIQGSARWPESDDLQVELVKISLIKVRQYGSRHHVDRQENRADRWKDADLSGAISGLWKDPNPWETSAKRILIFIGFDKTQRPFERELEDLRAQLHWDAKDVVFETRFWDDRAGRGFGVHLAIWFKEQNYETTTISR